MGSERVGHFVTLTLWNLIVRLHIFLQLFILLIIAMFKMAFVSVLLPWALALRELDFAIDAIFNI